MAGAEGQYYCWGCQLMFGEPDAPVLPSQLCPSCKRQPPTPADYEDHISRTPFEPPADDDATGTK